MVDETQDGYLTAQEVIDFPDVVEEDIVIPEWGGKKIRIRSLTKEQQFYIREQARKNAGEDASDDELRSAVEKLVITTVCVRPKFAETQIPQLVKKRASAIERILQKVNEMSGITPLAEQDKVAVTAASKSDPS